MALRWDTEGWKGWARKAPLHLNLPICPELLTESAPFGCPGRLVPTSAGSPLATPARSRLRLRKHLTSYVCGVGGIGYIAYEHVNLRRTQFAAVLSFPIHVRWTL